jgi:DnaJ-domain-containing protein 1
MWGIFRITRIGESYPTDTQTSGRSRGAPGNQSEDTVQISKEAYEKSKEYMKQFKNDASLDQSSQPQTESDIEILSMSPDATKEQIRKAYLGAMKQYHPDRFASLSSEFRTLAEEKSKQIISAYQRLIRV